MAENIKFGLDIPDVDLNKVDSGAIANSTSSSNAPASDLKVDKPAQTKQDQLDIINRDKERGLSISNPTTSPVNNVVDTDQLESNVSAGVSLPSEFVPEVISVDTPETVSVDAQGNEKKISDIKEQIKLLESQKEVVGMRDDVKAGFDSIGNIGAFESDLADDIDLQKKKEAKTEIDNKILKKTREFDLALRDAQDTFGTRAQKNSIKAEITKNYNRELADLAIIQMARAGEYNDARSYVDEKVRLELQDRRADLDGLIFLYQENKERFSKEDQRAFDKKIKEEERAYTEDYDKRKQLEDMKLTMTINATEAGAGNGTLQAIQNAKDTTALLSLPNAGVYTKSKADRLSEQLASINVATAQKELDLLNNPPANTAGMTPELQKTILGLGSGERTDLVNANDTVRSLERLQTLINENDFSILATDATEQGREFNRLAKDVADKMARERTGAVVTSNEEKTFKKIMGLTLFNRSISNKEEVIKTLDGQIRKHNESQNLVDPTGQIRTFLGSAQGSAVSVDDFLSQVNEQLNNPYSTYTGNSN